MLQVTKSLKMYPNNNSLRNGQVVWLISLAILALALAIIMQPSKVSSAPLATSAVTTLTTGSNYFLKVDLQDPRVRVRVGLANNDVGGKEPLSTMKNRYSGQNYAEWAVINGDYFGDYDSNGNPCPSNVNCAQGLTYIDGVKRDNWSAYGTTWPVRGNIGFNSSDYVQVAIGDGQTQRHMVVAGGPWIVKDGGPPTCSAQYVSGTTIFSTGELFTGDQRAYCTNTTALTMIGYSADRRYLFMGVSSGGQTVIQLGQWLKDQGAYDVLKLDSGGSSGIYHDGTLRKGSGGRAIANHLAIIVENQIIPTPTPQPPPPPSGWNQTFYSDNNLGSQCGARSESDVYMFRDSDGGWSPPGGCPGVETPWSVRMVRSDAYFQGGNYEFGLFYDDGARLYVDGILRVDGWNATQHYESQNITGGNHELKLEYKNNAGHAIVQLWWRGPGALPGNNQTQDPNQWWANYWGNQTQWQDSVGRENRGTGFIDINWQSGGPGFGIPSDHFSTRYERTVGFECGTYRFHLRSDDGSRLFIDGTSVPQLDHWSTNVWDTYTNVQLTAGNHVLKLDHFENGGGASLYLDWLLVSSCDNTPPTGQITAPANNSVVNSCPLTIQAQANDSESGVSLVEFHANYDGSWHHLGDDSSSPYSWNWDCSSLNEQGVWLTIHVWDNAGNEVMDPGGYVYVTLNHKSVSATDVWTGDANWNPKTTFNPGDPIKWVIAVNNTTGSDAQVEITYDVRNPSGQLVASWIGNVTTSPGVLSWGLPGTVPAVGGTYTFTGKVNDQGSITQDVTTYYVNPPPCYALTRSHTGSGGDPNATPGNSPGCPGGQYTAGATITLTASPSSGWHVSSWNGTNNDASTSNTNTVTMPASARTVTVNYTLTPATELVINSDMELDANADKIPDSWKKSTTILVKTDKQDCLTLAHGGSCSFTMKGNSTSKKLSQAKTITLPNGTPFTFSVWVKTNLVPKAGNYAQVKLVYTDLTTKVVKLTIPAATLDWTQYTASFSAAKKVKSVTVTLIYNQSGGFIWFDDVSLTTP